MSKKSCPKSIPGLTNMPKKTQTGNPTRNIYTSAWDWSDNVFNIKSKWSIYFECPHPVTLLLGSIPSVLSISVMETFPRKPLYDLRF